jgi:hypothetical protein
MTALARRVRPSWLGRVSRQQIIAVFTASLVCGACATGGGWKPVDLAFGRLEVPTGSDVRTFVRGTLLIVVNLPQRPLRVVVATTDEMPLNSRAFIDRILDEAGAPANAPRALTSSQNYIETHYGDDDLIFATWDRRSRLKRWISHGSNDRRRERHATHWFSVSISWRSRDAVSFGSLRVDSVCSGRSPSALTSNECSGRRVTAKYRVLGAHPCLGV